MDEEYDELWGEHVHRWLPTKAKKEHGPVELEEIQCLRCPAMSWRAVSPTVGRVVE